MGPIKKLNAKQETFCQNIAISLQEPADAYINAGYHNKSRLNAANCASSLLATPLVAMRVKELLDSKLLKSEKTSISTLHETAVKEAAEILSNGNDYTKISLIKEILARTEPIIKQSQSVHVTVSTKDKDKRLAALERKRQQVKAISVSSGEIDKTKNAPL